MLISAPIYHLKRKAKVLARTEGMPLHAALDRVAIAEGFQSWSHLTASHAKKTPAQRILTQLEAGQMILLGARPGQGKTLLALELAMRAADLGRQGYIFTLDYHQRDVEAAFETIGSGPGETQHTVIDTSDDISARYITGRLARDNRHALIVVDYLQLLDQKRNHPDLADQMDTLRAYTTKTGAICVLISQIDRGFELTGKEMPDASDVRLPNPFDLSVFDRLFFLHEGKVRMDKAA
ncbi:MAG: DNA helicase [Pseudomonadota bacterium]